MGNYFHLENKGNEYGQGRGVGKRQVAALGKIWYGIRFRDTMKKELLLELPQNGIGCPAKN